MTRRGFVPIGKEYLYKRMSRERVFEVLAEKNPALVEGTRLHGCMSKTWKHDLLILTPEAAKEMMDYFRWGERHPNNVFEQQAGLAGYVFKDPGTGLFTAVVETVIPTIAKNRTPVGARLSAEDAAAVQSEVNIMNRNLKHVPEFGTFTHQGDMIIVGWVHSHPNDLGVFLSGTDMETHRANYGQCKDGLGVSMVVNPHRRITRAFGGPAANVMEQIWLCDGAAYTRFTGKAAPVPMYMEMPEGGVGCVAEREKYRVPQTLIVKQPEVKSWKAAEEVALDVEKLVADITPTPEHAATKEAAAPAADAEPAPELVPEPANPTFEKNIEIREITPMPEQASGSAGARSGGSVRNSTSMRSIERVEGTPNKSEPHVTKLQHISHQPKMTTPTGGEWPRQNGVSDGQQSRGEIKYGDIAGRARHFDSSEEYYASQYGRQMSQQRWQGPTFAEALVNCWDFFCHNSFW